MGSSITIVVMTLFFFCLQSACQTVWMISRLATNCSSRNLFTTNTCLWRYRIVSRDCHGRQRGILSVADKCNMASRTQPNSQLFTIHAHAHTLTRTTDLNGDVVQTAFDDISIQCKNKKADQLVGQCETRRHSSHGDRRIDIDDNSK